MSNSKVVPSIQSLKQSAKKIASNNKVNLNVAQDLVANDYGFSHWSVMVKFFNSIRINSVWSAWKSFLPGEMILLSASEGVGKLSMALNLAAKALQERVKVRYLSLHADIKLISERLKKIAAPNLVDDSLLTQQLIVKDDISDLDLIRDEVNNESLGAVVFIDYLQAIKPDKKEQGYSDFLKEIKSIAQEKKLKIIVLSQEISKQINNSLSYIDGENNIDRHFSHVIHLEKQTMKNIEQRNIELLKSIHYQKQKSLLQFNKDNFRFP